MRYQASIVTWLMLALILAGCGESPPPDIAPTPTTDAMPTPTATPSPTAMPATSTPTAETMPTPEATPSPVPSPTPTAVPSTEGMPASTATPTTMPTPTPTAMLAPEAAPTPTAAPTAGTMSVEEYIEWWCAFNDAEEEVADDATYAEFAAIMATGIEIMSAVAPPPELADLHNAMLGVLRGTKAALDEQPPDDVVGIEFLLELFTLLESQQARLAELEAGIPAGIRQQMEATGCSFVAS